jgi:quinolinate synthase
MHIWMGECHVHSCIPPQRIEEKMQEHPKAELLIHPECGCLTPYLDRAARNNSVLKVASTEGMIKQAEASNASEFVVATEIGILHRLKKTNPDKTFYPIDDEMSCRFMKMITVPKLHDSLLNDQFIVTVPADIAAAAKLAIDRMISIY